MKESKNAVSAAKANQHLYYIDILNIFACFSVICLHCSGIVFNFESSKLWFISMAVQTVSHCAVPIFFMITGATLLNYREKYDTRTFFKKRVIKTLIPFLFWTLVYYFYPYILGKNGELPDLNGFLGAVFNNQANYIFWFFYVIFAIYISIPVLSFITQKKNIRAVEYICVVGFFACSVYPLFTRFVTPVYSGVIPGIVTGYMVYVFLGWLIKNKDYTVKQRVLVYCAGAAGALLMFFGTYFINLGSDSFDTIFMDYDSIACFPMAAAIFMSAKYIKWEKLFKVIPEKAIKVLPTASLGIYVTHMFVLIGFEHNKWFAVHPVYHMVLLPFIAYFICLAGILLLKKIPIIKHIIP